MASNLPEDDLEAARAVLAPTLQATEAILPWVAKRRPPRYDTKLNKRWIAAGKRLAEAWADRHGTGTEEVRSAIFALYAIALEIGESDCLRLGETLAGAADRLENGDPSPRLIAALSAAVESLNEPAGLEHEAFSERARHFADRLEASASSAGGDERSAVLDRLFVGEANEQVESMRDALATLPPDAYVLQTEAIKLAQQAEQLELWGIMHLARQLAESVTRHASALDAPSQRQQIEKLLADLEKTIAAVGV